MIKHIVCFKLKDNSPQKKQEAAEKLLSMEGKVPMIKAIEVGTDFLGSERSYDVILQVTLESRKMLDAYQTTNTIAALLSPICMRCAKPPLQLITIFKAISKFIQ